MDYRPGLFAPAAADAIFARLGAEIAWRPETVVMFGRARTLARRVAWHGDAGAIYRYSGIARRPAPWTALLGRLRRAAEDLAGLPFNAVLLNLYRDGREQMGWHSDDEPELGPAPVVVSFSFGAARRFLFRSRPPLMPARHEIMLEHGSGLVMRAGCQAGWQHALPRMTRLGAPRINLTFRLVGPAAMAGATLPSHGESAINRS
ncbi:MAG: alpha-ketoglutarate-dependent dioxygenase AlkB [Alphaproteobacteria bacterium]|nr:alpha-ketoglutarate-dependent dioxygenase AlkB [Alphaproteobacteria bacterium]